MPYRIRDRAIIHEVLDDEAVLADLEKGIYYSIRGTGIPIWQLLIAGHSLSTIFEQAAKHYPDQVFDPIRDFVQTILNENLIGEDETAPTKDAPPLCWPKKWAPPNLEKYEEMRDLLALDPIHEVDELGWPSKS